MRFSVWPSLAQPFDDVVTTARYAESSGWDGVYLADHFMSNDAHKTGVEECWTSLAALAALVPRVRLGSLVAGNTYRHPAVLANMAATVDRISGGRLVLGVGAGWQQNEHDAYGIELPPPGPRLKRFAEACAILHSLLREPRTTFTGDYYRLVDAPLEPRPMQSPVPLLIGGAGEKVMLGIVARYADEWNCWGTPETLGHKISVLDGHCAAIGREPTEIHKSAQALVFMEGEGEVTGDRAALAGSSAALVEAIEQYAEAGVDEFIVPDFNLGAVPNRLRVYDRFFAEVAAHFR
jgi:F420-dependent oxidoreductase-like protein